LALECLELLKGVSRKRPAEKGIKRAELTTRPPAPPSAAERQKALAPTTPKWWSAKISPNSSWHFLTAGVETIRQVTHFRNM
jgi:hypothetical protein